MVAGQRPVMEELKEMCQRLEEQEVEAQVSYQALYYRYRYLIKLNLINPLMKAVSLRRLVH
jgi:hypothetical protein